MQRSTMTLLTLAIVVACGLRHVQGEAWVYDETKMRLYDTILKVGERIERDPALKAEWNERVAKDKTIELPPVDFTCDVSFGRSPERPTSVHRVRPGDIDVMAAFGDSISAGNGLGALTLPQVAIENRQEVFSIGGKGTLDEGVTTLPNIIRKFNPQVKGYSVCQSSEDNVDKSWFNVAQPGGTCDDMPSEARKLIDRMKADARVDYENDWKLLTMFVGGNDLCASCRRNYSKEAYYAFFESALTTLKAEMPRTIVNLVTMFDVTPLPSFSTGLACDLLQWGFCDCVRNSTTKPALRQLQMDYDEQYRQLADDPRFKADDFTVIRQPHMRDMEPPLDLENGGYLQGFLSPDCFHPNRIAHQGFSVYYWNGLLTPLDMKVTYINSSDMNIPLKCPTPEQPYIFTDENSAEVSKAVVSDFQPANEQKQPQPEQQQQQYIPPEVPRQRQQQQIQPQQQQSQDIPAM